MMAWREQEGRFDPFGLELPFSPGSLAERNGKDERDLLTAGDGPEALSWLDLEQLEDEDQFESETGWGGAKAAPPRPSLGGQLWSSRDTALRIKQAIFISPAALGRDKVEVLFYVHGLLGPCGGLPRGGVASFISEAQFALGASAVASGRPIILVVPQFQYGGSKTWSTHKLADPAVLNAYIDRRLAEVARVTGGAVPGVSGFLVAGHSKAYEVLYCLAQAHASAAMTQGPLGRLKSLWLLDASYGRFPIAAMQALLAAKPDLEIKQIYRAGSATDKFGGRRSAGRLSLIPLPAKSVSHCRVPAHCLGDLLATSLQGPAAAPEAFDEYEMEADPFSEAYSRGAFDEEEEEDSWEGEEPEAEARCSHNEALFEGAEPLLEEESWSDTGDQLAFRERVLAEHIKRTEKRKGIKAQPDLTEDQLGTIAGTDIKTRKDTAIAATILLNAVNTALLAAKATGDAAALKIRNISVTSGYRSGTRQLNLWRGVFRGYYNQTQAVREQLPGGPHSAAAIAYLLKAKSAGGFGLGGRIAAPGFSNHQSGAALDFLVNLTTGKPIKLDSRDKFRAIWRQSWWHKWMLAHAAKFGFYPIPTEEWHWEYRPAAAQSEHFGDAGAFDHETDDEWADAFADQLDEDESPEFEAEHFGKDASEWEYEAAWPEDGEGEGEGEGESNTSAAGWAERLWLVFHVTSTGIRDRGQLTDAVFNRRHPERGGQPIDLGEKGASVLVAEWKAIGKDVVDPVLAYVASQPKAMPAPPTPAASPIQALGSLPLFKDGREVGRYRFTAADREWLAKMVVWESGGGSTPEDRAVVLCVINRYAASYHRHFASFAAFLRAFSTTLQPVLKNAGAARRHMNSAQFVKTGGYYEKDPGVPKGQLKRHLEVQAKTWAELPAKAQTVASDALSGNLVDPGIGNADNFASTRIYFRQKYDRDPSVEEWRAFTEEIGKGKGRWIGDVPGLDQMKNAFFLSAQAQKIPGGAIRVTV